MKIENKEVSRLKQQPKNLNKAHNIRSFHCCVGYPEPVYTNARTSMLLSLRLFLSVIARNTVPRPL